MTTLKFSFVDDPDEVAVGAEDHDAPDPGRSGSDRPLIAGGREDAPVEPVEPKGSVIR
jgi:hypothetical protein